ncbi:hypothetical protein [Halorussus amylolyticus]|uniref:hypothetical protein n=1 Tax=Halorussus amylolyticus TaxID=1126242 RepID=UPI00138EDD25|nr:hypothetical protein [Halorussus amylolyticus]
MQGDGTHRETAAEYEHLRTKKKERQGNEEHAEVRDVFVGEDEVSLALAFEWTTGTERLTYDLGDDRDVLKLEALAASHGFEFEQIGFLEGETLPVVYTGSEWTPTVHRGYAEGEGSVSETFTTELRLLARELARSPKILRRLVELSRTMSTKQLILAVIIVKKLIIIALIAWLLL